MKRFSPTTFWTLFVGVFIGIYYRQFERYGAQALGDGIINTSWTILYVFFLNIVLGPKYQESAVKVAVCKYNLELTRY